MRKMSEWTNVRTHLHSRMKDLGLFERLCYCINTGEISLCKGLVEGGGKIPEPMKCIIKLKKKSFIENYAPTELNNRELL